MTEDAYGAMIRLNLAEGNSREILSRIPLGTPTSKGNIDELTLQELLFLNPQTLPIASIDRAYDGVIPVCRELSTSAGSVDALYVNQLGRMTLAEFKLWRNPQARREVVGQILDYAKELPPGATRIFSVRFQKRAMKQAMCFMSWWSAVTPGRTKPLSSTTFPAICDAESSCC